MKMNKSRIKRPPYFFRGSYSLESEETSRVSASITSFNETLFPESVGIRFVEDIEDSDIDTSRIIRGGQEEFSENWSVRGKFKCLAVGIRPVEILDEKSK